MNIAYKHLESKLRVGELTLGQWAALFVGTVTALVWGLYVSPFGTSLTIFSACYIGGLPAGVIFLATISEVDLPLVARAALRWRREEGRFVAGAASTTGGYVVHADERERQRREHRTELDELDLTALWEG